MSVLRADVRQRWCAWTQRFEGRVSWMYLDVKGLVTTGLGCLLATPEEAQALPFRHEGGLPASAQEVRSEWWAVRAMLPGRPASYYREAGALLLPEEAIDALALARLEAIADRLALAWPDFHAWPWQAQMALCSLAWAVGAGAARPGVTSAEWPRLHEALDARDWTRAAEECALSSPGTAGRSEAQRELFLAAQRAADAVGVE